MSKIQVLEDGMINKIAAGEVVERPGSVVKELVENAIDAKATQITIEIKNGGIDLIRISDNGIGIDEGDVFSAFLRHSTSKIRNMDDLENVMTLGFRGEALSSIASVSQMEMITKPAYQAMAKRIEFHGGKLIAEEMIGAADGTTIIMRNLFYNTPARRKFIKKPSSEGSFVSDIVNKLALGHPEVSFRYIVNSSEVLHTSSNGNLKNVVLAVYGKETAKNSLNVDYEKDGIKITGVACKPIVNRGNRSYGNIFINGRFIKSSIIESAVEDAYKTKIMVGKFPVYVLNLALQPNLVDVNVHPQKLEVRFSEEDMIYNAFKQAIENALKSEDLIPEVSIVKSNEKDRETPFANEVYHIDNNFSENYQIDKFIDGNAVKEEITPVNSKREVLKSLFASSESDENLYVVREALPNENYAVHTAPKIKKSSFFNEYRIIGQFFNTYWIVEQKDELFMIDQHAAHERVIFEELMAEYSAKTAVSQTLMEPFALHLSEIEIEVLNANLNLFENFGFIIENFGGEFVLKGVPFLLKGPESSSFFIEILDKLSHSKSSVENIASEKIDIIATISCKAAVKGNDRLSFIEAKSLVDRLLNIKNPFTCPHGRPTVVKFSKYEIEKMFKRIQ